ncbi:MAG: branched-chain amino acid ABC transporter permease [Limnochordia bacterium]
MRLQSKTILKALLYVAVVAIVPSLSSAPFYRHVLIMVGLYSLMGVAWNMQGGYTGLYSLGQSAFFGIGAYTSTMMLIKGGISPWIGMLCGGVIAAAVSVAVAFPTSRLRGPYFTIASMAFARTIQILFTNWDYVKGAIGLSLPLMGNTWTYMQFLSKIPYHIIIYSFLAVALLVCYYIERSRTGYYFKAIRDSEEVAEALGINTVKYRLIAAGLSGFFTAIAGTFYAQYVLYIDPESVLHHPLSVETVMVAAVGGAGTIWGPVLGAAILMPINLYARAWFGGAAKGIDLILYGLILMIIAIAQPTGLMGLLQSLVKRSGKGGTSIGTTTDASSAEPHDEVRGASR